MDKSIYKKLSEKQIGMSFSSMIVEYINTMLKKTVTEDDIPKIAMKCKFDNDVIRQIILDSKFGTSKLQIDFITFVYTLCVFVKYYNRRYYRKNDIIKLRELDVIELNKLYINYFKIR